MTTAWNWSNPPAYWPDTEHDYAPQGEPCSTCGRHTTPGHRYMCGACLSTTCESCQDREPCAVCQHLHDRERDYCEVDGQFGLGLAFPCTVILCNTGGPHRHRVTPL